jgi:hypothetical protein
MKPIEQLVLLQNDSNFDARSRMLLLTAKK